MHYYAPYPCFPNQCFTISQAQTITLTNDTGMNVEGLFMYTSDPQSGSLPRWVQFDLYPGRTIDFTFLPETSNRRIVIGPNGIPVVAGTNNYRVSQFNLQPPPDIWLITPDGQLVVFPRRYLHLTSLMHRPGGTQDNPIQVGCDSMYIGTLLDDLGNSHRIQRYDIEVLSNLIPCARNLELQDLITLYTDELIRKARAAVGLPPQ